MKTLMAITLLAASALPALAIGSLDIGLGPYVGVYGPSLKTLNNEVLLYIPRPSLGSAVEFGGQARVGLPPMFGAGLELGFWSKKDAWTEAVGQNRTQSNSVKVKLIPVSLFGDIGFPIVPQLLTARAGVSLGVTYGTLSTDAVRVDNNTAAEVWHHWATAKGSAFTPGLRAGLDWAVIPKITVGAEAGYRLGTIKDLKVKESHDPAEIGLVYLYTNHSTLQNLPLPLELGGLQARLIARYNF